MSTGKMHRGSSRQVLVAPEHNPEDSKTAFFSLNGCLSPRDLDHEEGLFRERDIVEQRRVDYHADQWRSRVRTAK